jgi:hypothetical protein
MPTVIITVSKTESAGCGAWFDAVAPWFSAGLDCALSFKLGFRAMEAAVLAGS